MRTSRFRLSPPAIIAVIALFLAIGGGAYAASTVGTRDITHGAVTRSKLARHAVSTSKLANKAVGTKQLKGGAVTGAKVDEATLGKVPSAANADHATNADSARDATTVGGMTVQKFSATPPPNTPLTRLATAGTLDLQVGCNSSGNPLFSVVPTSGAAAQGLRGSFDDGSGTSRVAAGTVPPTGVVVLDGSFASVSGDLNAATAAGAVTTIHWAARSATLFVPGGGNPDPNKCFFYGTAVSG